MEIVDAKHYPSVNAYLNRLPEGLLSYPECKGKPSFFRFAAADKRLALDRDKLPTEICELVESPPLPTTWVSEVLLNAALLAIHDRHFTDRDSYLKWVRESFGRTISSSLYSILMVVASPSMLIAGARLRWSAFHIGSSLSIDRIDRGHAITMTFPPMLLNDEIIAGSYAMAFEAIVIAAHGKVLASRCRDITDTGARIEIEWE